MGGPILQLHEMIDLLDDFVEDVQKRRFYIGGIVGTQAFKIAVECVMAHTEFQNICVVEGCQDYIGMTKTSPCNNHFFYADLIEETKIPDHGYASGFNHGYLVWNPLKIEYKHHVDLSCVGKFDYLIINDAHLIPPEVLVVFGNSYPGKMILISDPFEAGAERFIQYPGIVDTLTKVSPITALARKVFNFSSRSLDKSVPCSLKEAKIQPRSVGKFGNTVYVTDSDAIANFGWAKQYNSSFRKGQRLWVTDTRILRKHDLDGRPFTITKDTLLVIESVPTSTKKLRLKIWNTKFVFDSEVTYKKDKQEIGVINVRPANIILVNEMRYHKYPNTALVSEKPLEPRQTYLVLKNSKNLTIGT